MPDPRPPTLDDRLVLRERPAGKPAMYQAWRDLLFLHWEVDPAAIQRTLPPGLYADTFDGRAFLGVVPFFMGDIRPRGFPCVPWLSDFLECNVRTYVHDGQGRAGVWFYSLDCSRWIACWLGRRFFRLPYHWAKMRAQSGSETRYRLRRRTVSDFADFAYRPASEPQVAEPGTFAFFLVERYLLYAADPAGNLRRGRVFHRPYEISAAESPAFSALPIKWNGMPMPEGPPIHACHSRGVEVEVFALEYAGGLRGEALRRWQPAAAFGAGDLPPGGAPNPQKAPDENGRGLSRKGRAVRGSASP